MSSLILIAYATRSGSTGEVAERIGASMREAGFATEVQPVQHVQSINGVAAIILGTPLYFGRFPSNFRKFLIRHREALDSVSPWCFVLGPVRRDQADFDAARNEAVRQFERFPWLHPAEVHVFGGCWSLDRMPFPFSLARHLPMENSGEDIRDWAAIQNWAHGISHQMKPEASITGLIR